MPSRRWLPLGAAALGVALALLGSVLQAERYRSSALVVIGAPGSLPKPDPDFAPYTSVAIELLRTEAVARRTIDDLKLSETPKELLARVTVSAGKRSPVLRVSVEDGDRERARRIAQDLAESFTILFTDRFGAGAAALQATIWEQPQDAEQVAPRPRRNALLGALAGLIVGALALRLPPRRRGARAATPAPTPGAPPPEPAVVAPPPAVTGHAGDLEPAPVPAPEQAAPSEDAAGGAWNLHVLEQLVVGHGAEFPDRVEEWSFYLASLRDFAAPDGGLPRSFDALVDEVFCDLLDRR